MTRPNALLFAVSCLCAGAVGADDIRLRSGGTLTGEIAERTADQIVVDVGDGRITLPLSFVEHIVPRPMPRAIFRERAAALNDSDLPGWLTLARWASSERLPAEATSAYAHVLRLDPENAAGNLHAGRMRLGERWVGPDEYYAARGYVRFENNWMPPERREEIQRDRAIQAQRAEVARERAETAARMREADERVREAEARAQAAIAQAREAAARVSAVESELVLRRSHVDARHAAWRRQQPGTFTVCTVNGRSFFCDPPEVRACCFDAPGPGCFEPPEHHHSRQHDRRR